MSKEIREQINKMRNWKPSLVESELDEYFGGSGFKDERTYDSRGMSEEQKNFLDFATNYAFKDVVKSYNKKNKKFLGLTIKSEYVPDEEIIYYNDFTFSKTDDGNISWSSGNNGSYRPEGYFMGDKFSDESIKNRLQKLVDSYNMKKGTNVTIEGRKIIL